MRPSNRPLVCIALIGISVAVFLAIQWWNREQVLPPLLISQYYQPALPEIRNGEIWRLVTPIFLHFGIFHLTFNLLWTWELGKIVEGRQGSPWLGFVVLVIGVISNIAQYLVSGPVFGGMSGVVYGLFGYVWVQGNYNPGFGVRLNPSIVKLMLGWFVLCWSGLLERLFGLNVANTAHTAGLISGIIIGFLVYLLSGRRTA